MLYCMKENSTEMYKDSTLFLSFFFFSYYKFYDKILLFLHPIHLNSSKESPVTVFFLFLYILSEPECFLAFQRPIHHQKRWSFGETKLQFYTRVTHKAIGNNFFQKTIAKKIEKWVSTSVMCDDRKGFTSNDNLRPRDFFQVFSTLNALTNNLFYDSNKLKSQGEMWKMAK